MLGEHFQAGRGGALLTLTVPHELTDELRPLRSSVTEAWRRVRQLRAWRSWCERLEYLGDVRVLEITTGPRHGWHPHIHVLFCTARPLEEEELEAFRSWLFQAWSAAVVRLGWDPPVERVNGQLVGVTAERLRSSRAGAYIQQLNAALELTGGAEKVARGGNRTAWQLLASLAFDRTPDPADRRLWAEWIRGTKGARQLTWSRGRNNLRKLYGMGEELEDDELLAAEEAASEVIAVVHPGIFEHFAPRPGWCAYVLELAATGSGFAVERFLRWCRLHLSSGRLVTWPGG